MKSIKFYLISSIISSMIIFSFIASYSGYKSSISEFNKLLKIQLKLEAEHISSLFASSKTTDELKNKIKFSYENRNIYYKITSIQGEVILESKKLDIKIYPGYSFQKVNNIEMKLYSLYDNKNFWITVGEDHNKYISSSENVILASLKPLVLLIPLLSFFLLLTVNYSLKPIKKIEKFLSKKKVSDLKPVQIKDIPIELQFLQDELNQMLHRLNLSLDYEKQLNSDIAHELRTPISSIHMHSVNVKNNCNQKKCSFDLLFKSIESMKNTINQILLMNRILSDEKNQEFASSNLSKIIREVVAENYEKIKEKNIKITVTEKDYFINCNKNFIKIMCDNLINNAIKFNKINGNIIIYISKENNVTLRIEDSGVGIQNNFKDKIFSRNFKVSKNNPIGNGIGLNIVKKIIDIHNATITVSDSKNFKTGTSFLITFN